MGLFWDLIQQSQISEQRDTTATLDARVERLEHDLQHTNEVLHRLVVLLEEQYGQDLDQDGKIG
ncbi:MAG: hypothetical protein IIB58_13135 [Planctomycetes bacterium]|nr:hypothetical protein [Planctomycetota bacterium]